jgi:hypothetical protein
VAASIGIAVRSPHTVGPDELLAEADFAMYAAKALGKDRYQVFMPSLRDAVTAGVTEDRLLAGPQRSTTRPPGWTPASATTRRAQRLSSRCRPHRGQRIAGTVNHHHEARRGRNRSSFAETCHLCRRRDAGASRRVVRGLWGTPDLRLRPSGRSATP